MSDTINLYDGVNSSMFNQGGFIGRAFHYFKITDIRQMMLSNRTLYEYKQKIDSFQINRRSLSQEESKEMWKMRYAVDASFHSETKELIPKPLRIYSFIPMNIPIAVGLICLPTTKFNIAFFNLLNQTYNATLNYYTGSKSEDSIKFLALSFSLAVISSIGSGLMMKRLFKVNDSSNLLKQSLLRIGPSMIAGFLNLFFMRSNYFIKGLTIKDNNGNNLGTSRLVGYKAMLEGAISRSLLCSPLIINLIFLTKLKQNYKISRSCFKIIELLGCGFFLGLGLPLSISIFNQNGKLKIKYLEREIQDKLKHVEGDYVYYDKGM